MTAILLLLSITVVGCGSSADNGTSGLGLLTAPSALTATGEPAAKGFIEAPAGMQLVAADEATFKVRGEGVVTALGAGTACPALTFKIDEHSIRTSAATAYDGGVCADIAVGARLIIEAVTQPDGIFLAESIGVKAKPKLKKVSREGYVTSLVAGTACPALTVKIGEHTIATSAATVYEGGACAGIVVGAKLYVEGIHVEGTTGTGGSLLATSVRFKSMPKRKVVEGEAHVASLVTGTSCPALKFVIGEHTAATNAATAYSGGVCADIQVGARVHVKGTIQDDGTVLTTNVAIKSKSAGGTSTVSSLVAGTACPALKFVVLGVTIHTGADTEFKGGVCTDVVPGVRVEVKGSLEADGLHATRVHIKK